MTSYDDLTRMKGGMYTIVTVEKSSLNRENEHRVIDPELCDPNPDVKFEDCLRLLNSIIISI